MATVWVQITSLTVRITLYVCPFNCMAHTANIQYLWHILPTIDTFQYHCLSLTHNAQQCYNQNEYFQQQEPIGS
jgi:hypothetical protein